MLAIGGCRVFAPARHAAFSNTRNNALRARGFSATSAASARRGRPTSRADVVARPVTGKRLGNGVPCDQRRNVCLTTRSSRLWNDNAATRVFQAIRTIINDELKSVRLGLEAALS